MKPFVIRLLCLLLGGLCLTASAAPPNTSALHAWYKADAGLQASGWIVTAWQDSGPNPMGRTLDRVVGSPRLWRIQTASGPVAVLRLDGNSALWQSATQWGGLAAPRTVLALARITNGANGAFCDSSIPGSAGTTRIYGSAPGWRVLRFDQTSSRLEGFVLGANASLKNALRCDIAEVLVFSRQLSVAEVEEHSSYLREKWGMPVDVPSKEQYPESSGFPGLTTELLRKHETEGVHTYRMPALATTVKGTLLAVFDQRRRSGVELPSDIDTGLLRSTDNGDTWEPMRSILDYDVAEPDTRGNGVGSPCILVDRQTGRVFVAAMWSRGDRGWNGSGPGLQPDQSAQLVLTHSDDDGLTWSPPVSITPQVKKPEWRICFQGPGSGIQLQSGTLVFPAQFREAGGLARSCLLLSSDHGETWTASAPAVPGAPPTSEAQATELSDGAILLSMRDESRSGQRVWCRFDPATGTWGASWLALPDPSTRASLLRCSDGSLLFCNPASPRARSTLTVRTSRDDGRTWNGGRLIDPRTSNSSCLSVLADGRIAALYEGEGGLHLARFWPEDANLAAVPQQRQDPNQPPGWWSSRHTQKLKQTKQGRPDLLFLGDSAIQGWEGSGAKIWKDYYERRNAANYGYEGDATQNVLWRLNRGELEGLSPRLVVLHVGASNLDPGGFTPAQTFLGISAVLEAIQQKCPSSRVLLMALFPMDFRADSEVRKRCEEVNALLPSLADGKRVFLLNVNHVFLNSERTHLSNVFLDPVHLTTKGYSLWAEAIEPTVKMLLESAP